MQFSQPFSCLIPERSNTRGKKQTFHIDSLKCVITSACFDVRQAVVETVKASQRF